MTLYIIRDSPSQIGNSYFPAGYFKGNQLLIDPLPFEKRVHKVAAYILLLRSEQYLNKESLLTAASN